VIGKADFVAFTCSIHHEICVCNFFDEISTNRYSIVNFTVIQIKQERTHVLVVHFSTPIGFVLRYNLPAVLGYKLVLLSAVFEENPPTGNVGRSHQEMLIYNNSLYYTVVSNHVTLTQPSLHANILASDLGDVKLISPAGLTQVWVTFPDGQIAWTLFSIALSFATATGKAVLT